MKCAVHCPKGGDDLTGAALAVALIVGAYWVLAQVAVYLALAAVVLAVLGVAAVLVSRRLARRVCVPRWSAAYTPPVKRQRPVERAALTRGPLAIEAPKPVVPGVIIDATERTSHVV